MSISSLELLSRMLELPLLFDGSMSDQQSTSYSLQSVSVICTGMLREKFLHFLLVWESMQPILQALCVSCRDMYVPFSHTCLQALAFYLHVSVGCRLLYVGCLIRLTLIILYHYILTTRRQSVRNHSMMYLKRALLSPEFGRLPPQRWNTCFHEVNLEA